MSSKLECQELTVLQLAVVLLGGQKELVFLSFLQLKIINTKSGGKNDSPKLRKQGLLIKRLKRKY